MDVVTFVANPADPGVLHAAIMAGNPNLWNRGYVKATYHIDHFWLPLGSLPFRVVDQTRYWYGLFSHRRDRVWKGIVAVDFNNVAGDAAARLELGNKP